MLAPWREIKRSIKFGAFILLSLSNKKGADEQDVCRRRLPLKSFCPSLLWCSWNPSWMYSQGQPYSCSVVWTIYAQYHAEVPGLLWHSRIRYLPWLWCRKPMPSWSARPSPSSRTFIWSCEPYKAAPGRSGSGRPPPPSPLSPFPTHGPDWHTCGTDM